MQGSGLASNGQSVVMLCLPSRGECRLLDRQHCLTYFGIARKLYLQRTPLNSTGSCLYKAATKVG
jgi:hypothetical protein